MRTASCVFLGIAAIFLGGCNGPAAEPKTAAPSSEGTTTRSQQPPLDEPPAKGSVPGTTVNPDAGKGSQPEVKKGVGEGTSKGSVLAAEGLKRMGVPVYPASEAKEGAYSNDSPAGTTAGSVWTTVDDPEKVSKFYTTFLKLTAKSGVKRVESDTRTLVGTTKTGNKVTLSIVRQTGAKATEIQVTVTGKPER